MKKIECCRSGSICSGVLATDEEIDKHMTNYKNLPENKVSSKEYSVTKEGTGELQSKILSYLWDQTKDKDMILTFVGENGMVTLDRYSIGKGFDGKRGVGMCQVYETWHSNFIYKNGNKWEGFSEDFMDYKKQADYCIGIWKDAERRGILATTFQAYPNRHRSEHLLTFNDNSL